MPNADKHKYIFGADHKWHEREAIRPRHLRDHLAAEHGFDYFEICKWSHEELSVAHMLAHGVSATRPERTGFQHDSVIAE